MKGRGKGEVPLFVRVWRWECIVGGGRKSWIEAQELEGVWLIRNSSDRSCLAICDSVKDIGKMRGEGGGFLIRSKAH